MSVLTVNLDIQSTRKRNTRTYAVLSCANYKYFTLNVKSFMDVLAFCDSINVTLTYFRARKMCSWHP